MNLFKKLFLFLLLSLFITSCKHVNQPDIRGIAQSSDNIPVSYSVYGQGDITLFFVHGWSCDSRYWYKQILFFSKKYRIVTIDLAGHGHSGYARKDYTMPLFGDDVKSVIETLDAENVILIGHSMGGHVIAETALKLPNRVIGIIGIDTLHNVAYKYTKKEFDEFVTPLEDNFTQHTKDLVKNMFVKGSDEKLVEWIVSDMSTSPQNVGVSAIREYLDRYVTGNSKEPFRQINVPVYVINADSWHPTDIESNRLNINSHFEATIMKNSGHFIMLTKPGEFNKHLEKTIQKLIKKSNEPGRNSR